MELQIRKIKETCLYVSDLEATKRFYHEFLKLPVIGLSPGRHVFFSVGDDVLLCFVAEATRNEKVLPPHFAAGCQHMAFEVDSNQYSFWKARLHNMGIEITHEQKWKEGVYSFYFNDPDGHVLEIVTPGLW